MVSRQGGANFCRLAAARTGPEQFRKDGVRLGIAPLGDQVARAFRDEEQGDEVDAGRNDLHPEHPAPGGEAQPERGRRPAGRRRQGVVGDEGPGQTKDDHDLLDAGKATADGGRRDFRDVGWSQDTGRADAQAAHKPSQNELDRGIGCAGPYCADQKGDGRQQHHLATTDQIGEPTGDEGSGRATQQDGTDVHPRTERRQIERGFQPVLGAVDDSGVISEHEAAERRHGDDQDDEAKVHTLRPRQLHACEPCRFRHGSSR